jgi:hypothetical protein
MSRTQAWLAKHLGALAWVATVSSVPKTELPGRTLLCSERSAGDKHAVKWRAFFGAKG